MKNSTKHNSQPIQILTDEDTPLQLENLSMFLYDLVIIHDRLLLFSPYYGYQVPFGLNFYRRFGRHIEESDKLQVSLITSQSPIFIEVVTNAADIATLFLAALEIAKLVQKVVGRPRQKRMDKLIYQLLTDELEHHYPHVPPHLRHQFIMRLSRDISRLCTNKQITIKKLEAKSSKKNYKRRSR